MTPKEYASQPWPSFAVSLCVSVWEMTRSFFVVVAVYFFLNCLFYFIFFCLPVPPYWFFIFSSLLNMMLSPQQDIHKILGHFC